MCYAQEQFSDGFVPETVAKRLTATVKPRHLKELCETRSGGGQSLFTKTTVDGIPGYIIRNFTRYNKTAEERRAEIEANAERVRKFRANKRQTTTETTNE